MKAFTVVLLALAALASADPSHFAGRHTKRQPEPVAELPVTCPAANFASTVRVLESSSLTEEQPHIINFEITSALDSSGFVDLHYKINNGEIVNVRMNKLSEKLFNFGNIMLRPGDKLDYQFTYCIMVNGRQVDCDTEWFSFEMPRPQPVMTKKHKPEPVAEPVISCPALTFGQSVLLSPSADASSETKLHEVRFEITSAIDASGFVDLHYKINDGELVNVRMNKLSEKMFNYELLLRPGDKLDYFMTYCVMINGQQVDCDTEWFSFEMPRPQPVMTKKHKPEPVQEMCSPLEISSSLLSTGAATTKKDASMLKIRFESRTDIQMMGFVDLHYKVNNGELVNVRMNKLSEKVWEYELPELKTGDKIDFFFTYCYALGSLLCDFNTAMESLTVS